MGLLWYSAATVAFSAEYTIEAVQGPEASTTRASADGYFIFRLPDGINSHDGLSLAVDGAEVRIPAHQKISRRLVVSLNRQADHKVAVAFTTRGQDRWLYAPSGLVATHYDRYSARHGDVVSGKAMSELTDFSLTVTTNFRDIDYPKGTTSPVDKAIATADGMQVQWKFASLVTNQAMGMGMPPRTDAGPIATKMSFFAPVSLFFFFTVLFTVVVLKKIPLHPMHYMFISAAFFSFHILMAYLVDKISIHAAFWICSAVSVILVVSYMRLVTGVKFAVVYVGGAQLVYLLGFSYAFFFPGRTGLTIVIGAIMTLFVLMQATGRVKWNEVFSVRRRIAAALQADSQPTPPPPPPTWTERPKEDD